MPPYKEFYNIPYAQSNNIPTEQEADFDFKKRCREQNGIVMLRDPLQNAADVAQVGQTCYMKQDPATLNNYYYSDTVPSTWDPNSTTLSTCTCWENGDNSSFDNISKTWVKPSACGLSNNAQFSGSQFSGSFLTCDTMVEYGVGEQILLSEFDEIVNKIKSGQYRPGNEKERLELYMSLVYPNANVNRWRQMTLETIQAYYKDMEFYYKLPNQIMPTTQVTIHRSSDKQFYRVPKGVIVDQDQNRTGMTGPYIEVTRFGPTYSFLRDPTIFTGTYYYPVKGSGLYLPIGRSLVAYNKVHALKMLNTPNTEIVRIGGRDFQSFLQKDSEALWNKIKTTNPNAIESDYWVNTCVVKKDKDTIQDPTCKAYFSYTTVNIKYIPAALDTMIDEMVSGKCLRVVKKYINGKSVLVNVYYGLGDVADKFLAQLARDRTYDSIQFLREAQMSVQGDAIVGNEFLHLFEPIYSQAYLMRLDPFSKPYDIPCDPLIQPKVNYLLDQSIQTVSTQMLSNTFFDPWENNHFRLNIIVNR